MFLSGKRRPRRLAAVARCGTPNRFSEKATRRPQATRLLEEIGIEVSTGARATEVSADRVELADGSFIACELVVWAAGVKAPEVLAQLDRLETNRIYQLVVERRCTRRVTPIFS